MEIEISLVHTQFNMRLKNTELCHSWEYFNRNKMCFINGFIFTYVVPPFYAITITAYKSETKNEISIKIHTFIPVW